MKYTDKAYERLAWVIIATAALCIGSCNGAKAAEVYALIDIEHVSDVMRGQAPWASSDPEPYHDSIMAGITIDVSKRLDIDLLHGRKRLAGTAGNGEWESGSTLRLRFYPGGRKR